MAKSSLNLNAGSNLVGTQPSSLVPCASWYGRGTISSKFQIVIPKEGEEKLLEGGHHGHSDGTPYRDFTGRGERETPIAGHRITVQHIVIWHERMGMSADEIVSSQGLTLADVYAALTYYYDHRHEIDEAILADDSYVVELHKGIKSKLSGKIGG